MQKITNMISQVRTQAEDLLFLHRRFQEQNRDAIDDDRCPASLAFSGAPSGWTFWAIVFRVPPYSNWYGLEYKLEYALYRRTVIYKTGHVMLQHSN